MVINEVNSNTGTDFIEIMNVGIAPPTCPATSSSDNMDTRHGRDPRGHRVIAPGGFAVFYDGNGFSFGLGAADARASTCQTV